jgi:hypothetical protein
MTDERDRVPPDSGEAGEPIEERGVARSEGGRFFPLERDPEDDLMRMGTVTTSEPAPLPPDMEREAALEAIDERAAEDARLEVRRREHSAD